jgi:hypothetical protein
MQIMKKHLLVIACLALPLAAMAGDGKSEGKPQQHAKRPAPAASAPAPVAAASGVDSRAAVLASRQRSTLLGGCQRQAMDKNLSGVERKQFVLTCIAPK